MTLPKRIKDYIDIFKPYSLANKEHYKDLHSDFFSYIHVLLVQCVLILR